MFIKCNHLPILFVRDIHLTTCSFRFLSLGDICDWGFNCGDKFHKGEYLPTDFFSFGHSMAIAFELAETTADSDWLTTLILNLNKQYKNK